MSRKRRIFDIAMPPVEDVAAEDQDPDKVSARRGPMASAISENAESLRSRGAAEQAIREENDQLAHELIRLRRAGLIVEEVPLDQVHTDRLVRDRSEGPDPELDELKQSIRDVGLSNPIRVLPRDGGGFDLVQGMRRLRAYRALHAEAGQGAYCTIPAGILPQSDPMAQSYRRMVDENLIRKDISFAEMGQLARAYAEDPANACDDVDKAVALIFKSASYTKRSYIRAFAALVSRLKSLRFAEAIPRNLGVELKRRLDADAGLQARVARALDAAPERDADAELAILRGFAGEGAGEATLSMGKVDAGRRFARKPRTTFDVVSGGRHAKCTASAGRVEVRADIDFSAVDRRLLERAAEAFLAVLDRKG